MLFAFVARHVSYLHCVAVCVSPTHHAVACNVLVHAARAIRCITEPVSYRAWSYKTHACCMSLAQAELVVSHSIDSYITSSCICRAGGQ